MSENTNRDAQFISFAKLVLAEMLAQHEGDWIDFNSDDAVEVETYSHIIARRVYDLMQSACVDINNAQMTQGVRLHPNAMLRTIEDMLELPSEETKGK